MCGVCVCGCVCMACVCVCVCVRFTCAGQAGDDQRLKIFATVVVESVGDLHPHKLYFEEHQCNDGT